MGVAIGYFGISGNRICCPAAYLLSIVKYFVLYRLDPDFRDVTWMEDI